MTVLHICSTHTSQTEGKRSRIRCVGFGFSSRTCKILPIFEMMYVTFHLMWSDHLIWSRSDVAAAAAVHNAWRQIESLLHCFAQWKHEKQAAHWACVQACSCTSSLHASLSRSRIFKANWYGQRISLVGDLAENQSSVVTAQGFSARASETQTSVTILCIWAQLYMPICYVILLVCQLEILHMKT